MTDKIFDGLYRIVGQTFLHTLKINRLLHLCLIIHLIHKSNSWISGNQVLYRRITDGHCAHAWLTERDKSKTYKDTLAR